MTYLPLHIDVRSVRDLLDSREEFLLLDCREPDEYRHVRIEGATLLPLSETPTRVGELERYRNQRIIVYCHRGTRSLQLTQWLRERGFNQVQNMMGGIDAWALLIDTNLPQY